MCRHIILAIVVFFVLPLLCSCAKPEIECTINAWSRDSVNLVVHYTIINTGGSDDTKLQSGRWGGHIPLCILMTNGRKIAEYADGYPVKISIRCPDIGQTIEAYTSYRIESVFGEECLAVTGVGYIKDIIPLEPEIEKVYVSWK